MLCLALPWVLLRYFFRLFLSCCFLPKFFLQQFVVYLKVFLRYVLYKYWNVEYFKMKLFPFFRRNCARATWNRIRNVNSPGVKESLTFENKLKRFLAYKLEWWAQTMDFLWTAVHWTIVELDVDEIKKIKKMNKWKLLFLVFFFHHLRCRRTTKWISYSKET